ncbi:hypothetical protein DBR42_13520 [Pelomonas sp. HMWF004]|nr:hypothetical protein DBR42_13520 [Pelomonas sp. HMWF004]
MSRQQRPPSPPEALVPSLIAPSGGAQLDPHQRKFNRLLSQVQKARQELVDWERESALFGTAYAQVVRPLLRDASQARFNLAEQLDLLICAGKGWSRAERELFVELLCELCWGLADDADLTAELRARCQTLHDRHAPQTLEEAERETIEEMRAAFSEMTGLDLGDGDISSPEELLRRAHARMSEAQAAQPDAEADAQPAQRRRKPSKAAAARAEREKAEAEAASQSVREVYRKLAAALHPDRASDDADRTIRTERMQRANQAYAAGDLLALLSLQLEVEQVDAEHIARITSARASQLNGLLGEQLQEVRRSLLEQQFAFAEGYGFDPYERLSAKALGSLLKRERTSVLAEVAFLQSELRTLRGDKSIVKAWLRRQRQEREQAAAMDDLLDELLAFNPRRR